MWDLPALGDIYCKITALYQAVFIGKLADFLGQAIGGFGFNDQLLLGLSVRSGGEGVKSRGLVLGADF